MQRNRLNRMTAALVGAGVGLFALSASAAPVTSFSTAPVADAGATVDDPALVGKILNLMNVDVGGNDWTNSAVRIQLATGQVYNATNLFAGAVPVGTDAQPNPALWTLAGARNGRYDTFVNSKGTGATPNDAPTAATLLGTLNADFSPGPLPAIGLTTNGAQLVSVQWGNTVATDTGIFSVGRFTLSADATGTFIGQSLDSSSGGAPTNFSGIIVGGSMIIPEPTALGLLGLAAAGLLGRRRIA